jgi:hypothetical protein
MAKRSTFAGLGVHKESIASVAVHIPHRCQRGAEVGVSLRG